MTQPQFTQLQSLPPATETLVLGVHLYLKEGSFHANVEQADPEERRDSTSLGEDRDTGACERRV